MTTKEFGSLIKIVRVEQGLTQKQLEREGVVSAPTLSMIEKGDNALINTYIAVLARLGYRFVVEKIKD